MTTLDKLKIGQIAEVIKINTNNQALKRRMMDMGITRGAVVQVVRFAPLGDPIAIRVKDFIISIRKSDLSNVEVNVINKNLQNYNEK